MWSVGCLLAELRQHKPILTGSTEAEQMSLIFDLCGSPNPENWPSVDKLPHWEVVSNANENEQAKQRVLRERFHKFEPALLDLVDRLLVLDPSRRYTAEDCLRCAFLRDACKPEELGKLPFHGSAHEWERKRRRDLHHPQKVA
jgi:cyclin-dependent kinase 12/13